MTHLLLLILLLVVAMIFDLRQRRIPNAIPLCILVLSIAVLLLAPSLGVSPGWAASWIGMGVGLALTLPGYLVRAMGAGDVKLMAVAGFACGWPLALPLVAGTAVALGLHAGVALASGKREPQPAAPAMVVGGLVVMMLAVRS
ncbi:prepilin peptidase [Algiphilus sp.]|uniref:A24 family peptidase n=1 Tax=Algiphilus sp. TaxID=1872431 RepID=UPI0025B7F7A0|nr:A24 family peptidase [Algiphilus sp.]MCK5768782.1 prepilin peptidase [Algiphilus sp.]